VNLIGPVVHRTHQNFFDSLIGIVEDTLRLCLVRKLNYCLRKAEDPDVVDVIITSAVWDVKMKGLVPLLRNVYGYYVVKDAQGLMCLSRAWTEDYLGDGKYGKMRPGGVGVGSPFYIK
jgi:hypothetical protein